MNDYLPIFTLCIEHDYYANNCCRAIQICVSSSGKSLLKRRDLMFKQTNENQWVIYGNSQGAGVVDDSDVLTLEMILTEPDFMYFTIWEDFNFKRAYHLDLPLKVTEEKITKVISVLDLERKPKGDVLSTISVKLSNKMFQNAKDGTPVMNTLVFQAPKVYWEYILLSRNGDLNRNLKIEEASGRISFRKMKKVKMQPFMDEVLYTIMDSPILMNEYYGFNLSLIEIIRENPIMKRVLIKQLKHPVIGRLITEKPNAMRQICYY